MRARSIASQKELVNIIESKEGSRRIYGNVHSLTIIHLSINHQPVNIRPSIKQTHPLTCQSKNHLPVRSVNQTSLTRTVSQSKKSLTSPVSQSKITYQSSQSKITYQSSQSIKNHQSSESIKNHLLVQSVNQKF